MSWAVLVLAVPAFCATAIFCNQERNWRIYYRSMDNTKRTREEDKLLLDWLLSNQLHKSFVSPIDVSQKKILK